MITNNILLLNVFSFLYRPFIILFPKLKAGTWNVFNFLGFCCNFTFTSWRNIRAEESTHTHTHTLWPSLNFLPHSGFHQTNRKGHHLQQARSRAISYTVKVWVSIYKTIYFELLIWDIELLLLFLFTIWNAANICINHLIDAIKETLTMSVWQ